MNGVVDLIGRILLSFIFIYEGIDSMLYFNKTKDLMSTYGITFQQDILLIGSIILLMFGGISLLIGYRSSFGSVLLLLYYIPVTFIVHSFWNDAEEATRRLQSIMFMKNLAIIGGLLMVFVNGSGKYSIKTLLANTRVPRRFR
ncbi:MAG: DoxX family protein [Saprospiraceae bacterium]|nr:DoxX family protein [Saprospiraceae bacterium]